MNSMLKGDGVMAEAHMHKNYKSHDRLDISMA